MSSRARDCRSDGLAGGTPRGQAGPGAPRRGLDAAGAHRAAADLLSRRAWTRADLTARLRRRGAPVEIAARVVDDLTDRGYLDDARFARQWVEARAGRGYGPARLDAELRMRGVATALVAEALAALDPGGELERVRAAARRRLPALGGRRDSRSAGRLRDYLLRRGFHAGAVARVVRELIHVDEENDGAGDAPAGDDAG